MNIQDLSAKPVEEKPKEGALLLEVMDRVKNPYAALAGVAANYTSWSKEYKKQWEKLRKLYG